MVRNLIEKANTATYITQKESGGQVLPLHMCKGTSLRDLLVGGIAVLLGSMLQGINKE
jgi:hypothetical protein